MRDWIKQAFDVEYTDLGVRKLLRRLGFSYTKLTYTFAEKQEAFKQEFEMLKKMMDVKID